MKKITINLTPEQETVLLARIEKCVSGMTTKEVNILGRKFKNPNEDTKKDIFSAKKARAEVVREIEIADGFIRQIQKQLNKKPSLYNPELYELLDKETPNEKVEEIYERGHRND